jgi:hypothetical protein
LLVGRHLPGRGDGKNRFYDKFIRPIDKIEDDAEAGEVRCEAIQMILDAFLWWLVKDRLNQKKIKAAISILDTANENPWPIRDYLKGLLNGDFLLGVKSEGE